MIFTYKEKMNDWTIQIIVLMSLIFVIILQKFFENRNFNFIDRLFYFENIKNRETVVLIIVGIIFGIFVSKKNISQ